MDDMNLYLRVEGLLSESFYMQPLDNHQQPFVEMDASEWPSDSSEQPEVCSDLGVELNTTQAWCIEDSGLVLRSTENGSINPCVSLFCRMQGVLEPCRRCFSASMAMLQRSPCHKESCASESASIRFLRSTMAPSEHPVCSNTPLVRTNR